jgi:hypothetical protein
MKKSKKILVLAAATVSLLSLAGCNEVTEKGNVIITFKDTNGKQTTYTADELFKNYTESDQDSTEKYYNAIYNVMVRQWFTLEENKTLKDECDKQAQINLDSLKSKASTNATDNSTSYDEEWEKILDSELSDIAESKRNEEELVLKLQLSEYKTKLEDTYYDTFKTWKKDTTTDASEEETNNLFWGEKGYLKERLPYHVKHILINVDASSGAYYNGQISSDNVRNLYLAVSELANGTNFGQIAEDLSDDSGSASKFGDLGIMDTSTSYVNEFKLGLYAYDTYFNTNEEVNSSLSSNSNPFNIPEDDATYVKSLGIASIPYGSLVKMYELKDVTTDDNNKIVNDDDATYYPRNVLFNKYFNNHNLAFITPDDLADADANLKLEDSDDLLNKHYTDLDEYGKWTNGATNSTYASMKGFQDVVLKNYDNNGNYTGTVTRKILCDNDGNPILVVRAGTSSYQGIHFIVVNRSALEENKTVTNNGETYNVPLNEYYANENPLTNSNGINPDFPQTASGKQKLTYMNSYSMTYDDYSSRADEVKSKVKGFDSNYEMRIYTWLVDKLNIKFNTISGVNIGERITNYIDQKRKSSEYSLLESNNQTWDNFIEQLEVQQSQRKTKLIPETCALHFKEGFKDNANATVKEACYHEK